MIAVVLLRLREARFVALSMSLAVLSSSTAWAVPAFPLFGGEVANDHLGRVAVAGVRYTGAINDARSLAYAVSGVVRVNDFVGRTFLLQASSGSSAGWGGSVTAVRNLRGDGFDAIAVGDPGFSSGQGRVSVYFGGPSADAIADLELVGEISGESHGWSIASVPDMNGDGSGELAVGGPDASTGAGIVRLYLGGPTPQATPALVLHGSTVGAQLGYSVAGCGRLDGDPFGELAVGAPGLAGGTGAVYLYRGGSTVDSLADRVLSSPTAAGYAEQPRFGAVLASDADMDGDGLSDLVVSAPGWSSGRGRVYEYSGTPGLPALARFTLDGPVPGETFGSTLVLDTLESAGTADLVVGARSAQVDAGTVRVYRGGAAPPSAPSTILDGLSADSHFGAALAVARIAPGSSVRKLFIAAPDQDAALGNEGFLFSYTPGVLVEVARRSIHLDADGARLADDAFIESRPRLVAALEAGGSLDPVRSRMLVDGAPSPASELQWLDSEGKATSDLGAVAALLWQPTLVEGHHVLQCDLSSQDGSTMGSTKVAVQVSTSLRLMSDRCWPQPGRDRVHLTFTMTRAGSYRVDWYDVQGRRVSSRAPRIATAGQQELVLEANGLPVTSGVLHYVITAQRGSERSTLKGRLVLVR